MAETVLVLSHPNHNKRPQLRYGYFPIRIRIFWKPEVTFHKLPAEYTIRMATPRVGVNPIWSYTRSINQLAICPM